MTHLIARQDDTVQILSRDRPLRVAKKLVAILRNECSLPETRLHMAQKIVAAGLKLSNLHGMSVAAFPRRWNRDAAMDALFELGTVPDRSLAQIAVMQLEEQHSYDLVPFNQRG